MEKPITKRAALIDGIGTAKLAEAIGVPAAHVRVWKSRRIPRTAYGEIMAAFPHVTLAMLKDAEVEADAEREAA